MYVELVDSSRPLRLSFLPDYTFCFQWLEWYRVQIKSTFLLWNFQAFHGRKRKLTFSASTTSHQYRDYRLTAKCAETTRQGCFSSYHLRVTCSYSLCTPATLCGKGWQENGSPNFGRSLGLNQLAFIQCLLCVCVCVCKVICRPGKLATWTISNVNLGSWEW